MYVDVSHFSVPKTDELLIDFVKLMIPRKSIYCIGESYEFNDLNAGLIITSKCIRM